MSGASPGLVPARLRDTGECRSGCCAVAESPPNAETWLHGLLLIVPDAAITVRDAVPADRDHLLRLLRELAPDASGVDVAAPTLVAELEGRVVGMVTLCLFRTLTGPKAYLDHMVVAPDLRRTGIGRSLLEHAERKPAKPVRPVST